MIRILLILSFLTQLDSQASSIRLDYYGQDLQLEDVTYRSPICNSPETIRKELPHLKFTHEKNYRTLDSFSVACELDGVGEFLLLEKVSKHLLKNDNDATLFAFAYLYEKYNIVLLYNQLGRLGIGYCSDISFGSERITLNKNHYYTFIPASNGLRNFQVYDPKMSVKKLDFKGVPNFKFKNIVRKTFQFNFYDEHIDTIIVKINGEKFVKTKKRGIVKDSMQIEIDRNAIHYYRDIPQVLDYQFYITGSPSIVFSNSLEKALKISLDGLSEAEKLKYLLSFTQSLPYLADGKRYFFPEETLWYEKSDCADRTFLYAYLIRNYTEYIPLILSHYYNTGTTKIEHLNVGFKCNEIRDFFEASEEIRLGDECVIMAETTNNTKIGTKEPRLKLRKINY